QRLPMGRDGRVMGVDCSRVGRNGFVSRRPLARRGPLESVAPRQEAGTKDVRDTGEIGGGMKRPDRDEAATYYFSYIHKVADDDSCGSLDRQSAETLAFLQIISDEQWLRRYAPDKWSIREVVGHINDTERLFVSRAFWFARGFDTPLPSFDQHVAVSFSGA